MKHTMIAELEVHGPTGRLTGFEVCVWCGVRRRIEIRVGEDPDECVGKPESKPEQGSAP